jgi:hypothetical protein
MTHRAAGAGRRTERGWLLPLTGIVLILLGVAAQLISRAIVIDFLAWWPVWLALVLLAFLARGRKWRRVRLPALVPLVTIIVLGIFVYGYFAGWEAMPSAVNRLVGPIEGPATVASMSIESEGRVDLDSSDLGFLYSTFPLRAGGMVGLPVASEQTQGSAVAVTLTPDPDSGFYTYSGWRVELSPVPIWSVDLSGDLDVDVSGLVLSDLHLAGSGLVLLGSPPADAIADITGDFRISVPAGTAVTIQGDAEVPENWETTPGGWVSPSSGPGWTIEVGDGSSVTMEEN